MSSTMSQINTSHRRRARQPRSRKNKSITVDRLETAVPRSACDNQIVTILREDIESDRVVPQPESCQLEDLPEGSILTPVNDDGWNVLTRPPRDECYHRPERSRQLAFSPTPALPSVSLALDWLQLAHDPSMSDEDASPSFQYSRPGSNSVEEPSPSFSFYPLCFEAINDRLLSYYHSNMTAVPWTNPSTALNPLRSILPLIGAFMPLRNAVMALSAAHYPLELSTCLTYKSQALSTFSEAIQDATNDSILEHLLATLLVLFNLQSVESGYGQWRMHLRGACQLLMARFRTRDVQVVLRERALLHSIVLQISWYDTACALLSLQACEVPDCFVRPAVLLSMEKTLDPAIGGMADTVGCPESIYLVMRGIVNGDITSPAEVLRDCPSDICGLVGKATSPNHATDRYHCEQAWKYGLVVYLLTMRREHIGRASLMDFCTNLVKTYTHHLTCSSFQKQLLLPVVIAGAQVDDLEAREWFEAYCARHRSVVKFAAYEDGLRILKETWLLRDEQMAKGLVPTACWADVTAPHGESQYMLG